MESWGISTLPFVISGPLAVVIMHFLAGGRLPEHPVIAIPPFCVGLIAGRVWFVLERIGWDQIFFWVCVVAGAVLVIGVIVCGVWFGWPLVEHFKPMPPRAHQNLVSQPFQVPPNLRFSGTQGSVSQRVVQPAPQFNQVNGPSIRPGTMYHATPELMDALDIYQNRRFKVGPSTPFGFYLSPDFNWVSETYGKVNGAVIEFIAPQNLQLREKGNSGDFFYIHTPNSNVGDYISFPPDLFLMRILNCQGQEIFK